MNENLAIKKLYAVIGYFVIMNLLAYIVILPLVMLFLGIDDITEIGTYGGTLINFITYAVLLILFIILLKNYYIKEFHHFKKKVSLYMLMAIGCFVATYLLSLIINVILYALGVGGVSENQQAIEESLKYPLLIIPPIIIAAPIIEETVFRGIIFKYFKNLNLPLKLNVISAFFISSVLFGLIHVLMAFLITGDVNELILILPYVAAGFMFSLFYYLTNNIYVCIIAHFLNNLVSVILIYLLRWLQSILPEAFTESDTLIVYIINFFSSFLN